MGMLVSDMVYEDYIPYQAVFCIHGWRFDNIFCHGIAHFQPFTKKLNFVILRSPIPEQRCPADSQHSPAAALAAKLWSSRNTGGKNKVGKDLFQKNPYFFG
jgi:hypothetical protein